MRLLGKSLSLPGMDAFVASSFGALHAFGARSEGLFGGGPCLVAIEPVSGVVFVEEYQPRRDAQTWADAIGRGLAGLPRKVVLMTSSEPRGLTYFAERLLRVQHLAQRFHGRRDPGQPLFGPLRRRMEAARKDMERHQVVTQRRVWGWERRRSWAACRVKWRGCAGDRLRPANDRRALILPRRGHPRGRRRRPGA